MQIPEVIKKLSIDLETYSSVPIKYGVYPYAESPDAEILLFGYSINDEPVIVVDVANGEKIPDYIMKALTDDSVINGHSMHHSSESFSPTGLTETIQNTLKVTVSRKIPLVIISPRPHGDAV